MVVSGVSNTHLRIDLFGGKITYFAGFWPKRVRTLEDSALTSEAVVKGGFERYPGSGLVYTWKEVFLR